MSVGKRKILPRPGSFNDDIRPAVWGAGVEVVFRRISSGAMRLLVVRQPIFDSGRMAEEIAF